MMIREIQHQGTSVYRINRSKMGVARMARIDNVAGVPNLPRENDPYDADAIREAIDRALAFKKISRTAAAKGAGHNDKALTNFYLPPDHREQTDTLRLSTVLRIARFLGLTVSQFIGETPLEATPTSPQESVQSSLMYAEVLAMQAAEIAQLRAEIARVRAARGQKES